MPNSSAELPRPRLSISPLSSKNRTSISLTTTLPSLPASTYSNKPVGRSPSAHTISLALPIKSPADAPSRRVLHEVQIHSGSHDPSSRPIDLAPGTTHLTHNLLQRGDTVPPPTEMFQHPNQIRAEHVCRALPDEQHASIPKNARNIQIFLLLIV
ncbi:hypothetical protein E4U56_008350 [Claviceps arundinis]|uniref:Uncharacterized protein n=1 Tax=Claviceps arundinis TaxID=1623583 RepID=A0A9P7MTZ8_9HYPO|nr:hypothetical protein E4U56_008350 [Claviceps arundinis]